MWVFLGVTKISFFWGVHEIPDFFWGGGEGTVDAWPEPT